jgi:hypothetical protein
MSKYRSLCVCVANPAAALWLIVTLLALIPTPGAAAAEQLLSNERWREHSRGLSLQPPLGSRLLELTADEAILRITGEGGYSIKVYIKCRKEKSGKEMAFDLDQRKNISPDKARDSARPLGDVALPETDLKLDDVTEMAVKQIANVQPGAVLIDRKPIEQKLPTAVLYFRIPNSKRGTWVLGQSLCILDDQTVAMLQLEVAPEHYEQVKPLFEAVAKSLEVEDLAKLDVKRNAMLEKSEKWLNAMNNKAVREKLVPEQWLRIVDGGKDVGHMRITQKAERQMDMPGMQVDVQAHIEVGDQSLDSLANFFASDDGQNEIWSVRTTSRSTKPAPKGKAMPEALSTFAETGVRSKNQITVTRQSPAGTTEFHWDRPFKQPKAAAAPGASPVPGAPVAAPSPNAKPAPAPLVPLPYLSQVDLQLLDITLPRKAPLELGYYAYNPTVGKISFRTERVVPQPDGSCLVYSRVSPEQPEQVTQFSASGKFMKRTLPGGQTMFPTTKSELAARAQTK